MTATVMARPSVASPANGGGGIPAGRAVVRWAWRLFRREWRQQILVLALITIAVAGTIFGAAVATNTPPPPNAGFGTANSLITIPGSDPHVAADVAALQKQVGTVDVIENATIATGTTGAAQLRAQDPHGAFGSSMLSLVQGRYPAGPHEVALTPSIASTFDVGVGAMWHADGRSLQVVGIVQNPQNFADNFALVALGELPNPDVVVVLFDASTERLNAAQKHGYALPLRATLQSPAGPSNGIPPDLIVLAADTFGLLFIGLVSIAGFTVMANRRTRAFGMLGSIGATDRHIRLVMVANGAVVGVVATALGATLGVVSWVVYHPHLESSAGHAIALWSLPWWLVATSIVLAIGTSIVAAWWPSRAVVRVPIVAALSGRPPEVGIVEKYRSALISAGLLLVGFVLIASGSNVGKMGHGSIPSVLAGIVAVTIGGIFLAPHAIAALSSIVHNAPVTIRLAIRDLARYRSRSGASLGAISFAITIAVIVCVAASSRYGNVLDYVGPNLPANQLMVYAPDANLNQGGKGGPAPSHAQAQAIEALPGALEAALGTHDLLALQTTSATLTSLNPPQGNGNFQGAVYAGTPALLRFYGIPQSAVDPTSDVLTARVGLSGVALVYGDYFGPQGNGPPPITQCPPGSCVANPSIQTLSGLPAYTTAPNVVVSEHAIRTLGLQPTLAGWLLQTPQPLTAVQINTARQLALAAGTTIETKNDIPSLAELDSLATLVGVLLALGVLAMTVGLIRSETASELRILTATGASRMTRRALTAVTAGSLGLLGALLGTAMGYFALIAFTLGDLGGYLSHPPTNELLVILIGLPLLGALGGWCFAGREPKVISRAPLE